MALLLLRNLLHSFCNALRPLSQTPQTGPSAADMAVFLLLCVFFAVGLALLALQLKLRMSVHGPQEPPRLPSLPLIGSLLSLRSPHPPHLLFKELQRKYGQTYSLMMGSHCVIIVNHHTHAKEVLMKKGKIFAGRPRTVTTDVLTRDGKDIAFGDYSTTWRFHRKIVHGALCMFGEGSAAIEKISEYSLHSSNMFPLTS
nr:steroid 17-alpha-hydroxylase/17,20 lyase-like [Labrus bergylta]